MNLVSRFVRVLVSGVLGYALEWLTNAGVMLPEGFRESLEPLLVVLFAAVLNAGIGAAAKKFPALEWLLGIGVAPVYPKPDGPIMDYKR